MTTRDAYKLPSEFGNIKDWVRILAQYREPNHLRSCTELSLTIGPFILIWAIAWWSLSNSYWLSLAISLCNGLFLFRLFVIQHDCGHGAFFKNRNANDWLGRIIGVVTLTPFDVWRHLHSIHHSTSGNLERRGFGDVDTLTVAEYRLLPKFNRLIYRLYPHPIVMFGIGPAFQFLLKHRLPVGVMKNFKFWLSAMGTNAATLISLAFIVHFGGIMPVLLVFLPCTLLAATAGVWVFYVQHQFENTYWEADKNWQLHQAALHGSSHYVMPRVLRWFSGNIGIHHVHHLYSRIPFYRLPEVLRDHAPLREINRLTIKESFANARLHLWDENSKSLLSFSDAELLKD